MTETNEIQQPGTQSLITISEEDLETRMTLPRYLPMDTGSDVLHHSLSEEGSLLAPYRPGSESEIRAFLDRQYSFREEFGHAAAETYLVTRLSFTLLQYLGVGYRWMTRLAALGLYGMLIMPGFIQVSWHYFCDKRIVRSIVYGQEPRNRLDLYLPENLDTPKPVIAFVTGGAWIIGYKAWGSLLGLQLVDHDVIVACIDYRNFPQGTISDMVADVSEAISFLCNNIASFGGDPDRLYLAGQSAGAHIAACALLEQVKKESERAKRQQASEENQRDEAELAWSASQFKGYFSISGGYNLYHLVDHFHNRGLYRILFLSIMEGEGSLHRHSPALFLQSLSLANAGSLLPPMFLFHGTADYSIPCEASTSFAEVLASFGVQVATRLYEGKTHTDLFIQDPMRGGYNALLADILAVVHAGDTEAQLKDASAGPRKRLVPEFCLNLAHRVSPF